jgi:hypothetical protein
MAKFYRKSDVQMNEQTGGSYPIAVFTGHQVEETETVPFQNTSIIVTPPNYVLTDKDGNSFGVAEEDFDRMYVEAEEE